ncbi:MAG: hypothetical protein MK135_09745 [Polyangiaceae bacterium]|nr:hypothetical protein [Polyangiaceae bacterium]
MGSLRRARTVLGCGCFLLCLLSSSLGVAWADSGTSPPSAGGQPVAPAQKELHWRVGVDRLFGVSGYLSDDPVHTGLGDITQRNAGVQVQAFALSSSFGDSVDAVNFSSIPRLFVEIPLYRRWFIGVASGVSWLKNRTQTSLDEGDFGEVMVVNSTYIVSQLRLGYSFPLNQWLLLEPRLGPQFGFRFASSQGRREKTIQLQGSLELPWTFVLGPWVRLSVIPYADLSIWGDSSKVNRVSGLPEFDSGGKPRSYGWGLTSSLGFEFP